MSKIFVLGIATFLLFISANTYAEQTTIIGKVRHVNNYQEIEAVNIYIENSNIGTVTRSDGSFELQISDSLLQSTIVFDHVSYDTLHVPVLAALLKDNFYLQPKIIQGSLITVQAMRELPEILKDLPQPFSMISSKRFEVQGYLDAGDLLRTQQNIQVEEELSGKKTIALRAGNPDDVIILYNGIKMNNGYDNSFDLSLINLEDVRHFEIIRGSNTSLYGAEAFSGVINVVPKLYKNYNVRFTQRIGTYASGSWNLQLNHNFWNRLNISFSYKQGGMKRAYADDGIQSDFLKNKISNQNANIVYDLSNHDSKKEQNISLMYVKSNTEYENTRFNEELKNTNQFISMRYTGDIAFIKDITINTGYQWFENSQNVALESGFIDRRFDDHTISLNMDKKFKLTYFDFLLGYQYQNGNLDIFNMRRVDYEKPLGIQSGLFSRNKHGIVSVIKYHLKTDSDFIKVADIDISYRYDDVQNDHGDLLYRDSYASQEQLEAYRQLEDNDWRESTFKFSTHFQGDHKYFRLNGYMNYGTNIKFPSLFQQLSFPFTAGPYAMATRPNLSPEKNKSAEIGLDLLKENTGLTKINGWQLSFNYFQNFYDNKFREFYTPGVPIAFYDNVHNATITGLESRLKLFMLRNKITLEFGTSKYIISEKAAFPFKSDLKFVANLLIEHAGYSLQAFTFRESEQIGWITDFQGIPWEVKLPPYFNIDIHFSKTFEFNRFKILLNFSGRNLIEDQTELAGLALRDRRFYMTFGMQY